MDLAAEDIVLRLAAQHHGVVARWQLIAAGLPGRRIDDYVRRGRIELLHRAVYRVAALCDDRSAYLGLVLSFGRLASASHGFAAELHGWLPPMPALRRISVTGGKPDSRPGMTICRARILDDELCVCDGIPATTGDRTLLDLAAIAPDRVLEQAIAAALRTSLVTGESLGLLMSRYPRRHGVPRLRSLLADPTGAHPAFTRSEAEDRFLELIRRAKAPPPAVNSQLLGFEVDFHWKAQRLVVEIDGMAYHSSRQAQLRDRRRDVALGAGGFRVLRFTWSDLVDRPEATLTNVVFALARAGS